MEDLKMLNGSIETGSRGTFSSAVCAVLLFFIFWVMLPSVVCAASSDTDLPVDPSLTTAGEACSEACPPDTLTVEAGYSNWPADKYEVKKVFTLSEIKTMRNCGMYYTFIGDTNELIIDFTWGICLTDLLPAAGVVIDDIEELVFYSENGEDQQSVSFSKAELLDTRRFCNYSLQKYYDSETGSIREYKRWSKAMVNPMLAFEEAWLSPAEITGFEGEDNLSSDNRFRLVFGQTDRLERNMSRAIPHIHTVSVIFSGSAPEPVADTVNYHENSEAVQDENVDNEADSGIESNDEGTAESVPDPDADNSAGNDKVQDTDALIEGTGKNTTYSDRSESLEEINTVPYEEPEIVVLPASLNTPQISVSPLIRTTPAVPSVNTVFASASENETGHSLPTPVSGNQESFTSPTPTSPYPADNMPFAPATEEPEVFGEPSHGSVDSIPSGDGTGQYAESMPLPEPEDGVAEFPDLQKTRRILCLAAFSLILWILFNTLLRYLRSRYEKEKKADEGNSYDGRIQGDLL